MLARWGRGAVGSAPRWHRGGRGFESHRLHQIDVIPPRILAKRILSAVLIVSAASYGGDFLWFRFRMLHARPSDPLETLKTLRVLAIPEKGGKTSYEIDQQNPEQTVTCVHSLFPHAGFSPCWYVQPRLSQPIQM